MNTLLQVLMISTSYPRDLADWRGLFIRHLTDALARRDDVKLRVWSPPGELHPNAIPIMSASESAWLSTLMTSGGVSQHMRRGGLAALMSPARLLWLLAQAFRRCPEVALYHVNWLQCALPLPRDGKPVLITVLGNDMKLLRLPLVRPLLRRAMRGRRVVICPNADWMQVPLQRLFGDLAEIAVVAFGIDPRWYAIKRAAPPGPPQWLAVTRLTADKLGPLFEWGAPCFGDGQRQLHLFGPMQEPVTVPAWVHYHGSATPDALATRWFNRCHGLITLSRHAEGRPQVMLEAMAAGLPIVASTLPAHDDLLDDGVTGRLVANAVAFAQALDELDRIDANMRMGSAARIGIKALCGTWDDCAARYVSHYRSLMAPMQSSALDKP